MQLSLNEILASFHGTLNLDFKILREIYNAQSFELLPENSSPLHLEDSAGEPMTLFLPLDATIGTTTLRQKQWDPNKQIVLGQIMRDVSEDVTLIDVGSNVGLFSRQCLNRIAQIRKVYCYEPNPLNYKLLSRNIGATGMAQLNNYGLSDAAGSLDFHLDPDNAGNYSLVKSAMPAVFRTIEIEAKEARAEAKRWLGENDGRFIYKSDTQGHDEVIATALEMDFWSRVKAGIFELWRLPGKVYDVDKLATILDFFPQKVFEKAPNTNISSKQVLAYLDAADMQFDDLYFWR